jgi:Fic family protein
MMFLVCEVHPFDDANGRLARVMMNAELVAGR